MLIWICFCCEPMRVQVLRAALQESPGHSPEVFGGYEDNCWICCTAASLRRLPTFSIKTSVGPWSKETHAASTLYLMLWNIMGVSTAKRLFMGDFWQTCILVPLASVMAGGILDSMVSLSFFGSYFCLSQHQSNVLTFKKPQVMPSLVVAPNLRRDVQGHDFSHLPIFETQPQLSEKDSIGVWMLHDLSNWVGVEFLT